MSGCCRCAGKGSRRCSVRRRRQCAHGSYDARADSVRPLPKGRNECRAVCPPDSDRRGHAERGALLNRRKCPAARFPSAGALGHGHDAYSSGNQSCRSNGGLRCGRTSLSDRTRPSAASDHSRARYADYLQRYPAFRADLRFFVVYSAGCASPL